jgi:small subunit ribosomal protein S1
VEPKGEDGEPRPLKVGDAVKAEIANIDTQDRRLTLTMRAGEGTQQAAASAGGGASQQSASPKGEKRESRAPKKAADDAKAVGSIGELIKQKLGGKLGLPADAKEEGKDSKSDEAEDDKEED